MPARDLVELGRAWRKAGERSTMRKLIREGMRPVRRQLLTAARGRLSRVSTRRTGRLARAVRVRFRPTGLGVGVMEDAFYGRFLEDGSRHQPATPFLHPAAEDTAPAAARSFADVLEQALVDGRVP